MRIFSIRTLTGRSSLNPVGHKRPSHGKEDLDPAFGDVSMTNLLRVELANLCDPHCNNADIGLYCSPF